MAAEHVIIAPLWRLSLPFLGALHNTVSAAVMAFAVNGSAGSARKCYKPDERVQLIENCSKKLIHIKATNGSIGYPFLGQSALRCNIDFNILNANSPFLSRVYCQQTTLLD